MKFSMNSKGYTYSPFFIIVLMLTAVFMTTYFMKVDNAKAQAIKNEGELTKKQLKLEETKSAVQSAVLFFAYDAIDNCIKPTPKDPEELKGCLEAKIKQELNQQIHESDGGKRLWHFSSKDSLVEVIYKDKNDRIRNDGFIVKAKGEQLDYRGAATGLQITSEKYIDSNIFAYFDKAKNAKSSFLNDLASNMMCKFGAIGCRVSGGEIRCDIEDDFKGPETIPNIDNFRNADVVVEKIKAALEEVAMGHAKGTGMYLGPYAKSNAAVVFSVDKIDVSIDAEKRHYESFDYKYCCNWIRTDERNWCENGKYEEFDSITLTVKGTINVKEFYMIGDGALKEDGSGGFEACVKSPIITRNGEFKPLMFKEQPFGIDYTISIKYQTICDPGNIVLKRTAGTGRLSEDEIIPGIHLNEESLKYTADDMECKWEYDPNYERECLEGEIEGITLTRKAYAACSVCRNGCYYTKDPIRLYEPRCPGV